MKIRIFHCSESANTNEYRRLSDIGPATKPVLKSRGKPKNIIGVNDDQGSSHNNAGHSGPSVKRSVTFRDGLHPGFSSNETQTSTTDMGSSKLKKVFLFRTNVSGVNPYLK